MSKPITEVIAALKAAGLSYSGQAYVVGVGDRTISNWAAGIGKPDYEQYERLVEQYEQFCEKRTG